MNTSTSQPSRTQALGTHAPVPLLLAAAPRSDVLAMVRLELRRALRNRRSLMFTLLFPGLMFTVVANSIPPDQRQLGPGLLANVGAYIMVSMALYGTAMAATSAGATVASERGSGWNRYLRTSPLSPASYVAVKVCAALAMGVAALAAAYAVGAGSGIAVMPTSAWWQSGLLILIGGLVFSSFGLMVGFIVPGDNVMQIVGPLLAVLAFLGGLFQGPIDTASLIGRIQSCTPLYGLSQLAHWPLTLTADGAHAPFEFSWLINVIGWGLAFAALAAWSYSRDTGRQ